MTGLAALETLYESDAGPGLPLPPALAALYGPLHLPAQPHHPYVIGNFVTTLDGVAALDVPGHEGGGDISGFHAQDRMVMGLLRALGDAVVIGAGTLRADPEHLWTPAYICPDLAGAYEELRRTLGKADPPLTVIVTASGALPLDRPVFHSGAAPVLIVTTAAGRERLGRQHGGSSVSSVALEETSSSNCLEAGAILAAVQRAQPGAVLLVEGGPRLMGDIVAERRLDELFLTVAPQIAGRDAGGARPGLVAGRRFAPADPRWSTLRSIKRGGSHLFLRYALDRAGNAPREQEPL